MARIVKWAVRLEAIDADGKKLELSEAMTIVRDLDRAGDADFGLKLSEGKAVLEQLQERIARTLAQLALRDRICAACRSQRPIQSPRAATHGPCRRYGARQITLASVRLPMRSPSNNCPTKP